MQNENDSNYLQQIRDSEIHKKNNNNNNQIGEFQFTKSNFFQQQQKKMKKSKQLM